MDLSDRTIRPAFTLVEVLVTIGIIGLLIAILLPALSVARASGRTTACLAGQREIGRAFVLRAGNHSGYTQLAGVIEVPAGSAPADTAAACDDSGRTRYTYINLGPLGGGPVDAMLQSPEEDLVDYLGFFGQYAGTPGEPGPDDASPWRCGEVRGEPLRQFTAYYRTGDDFTTLLANPRWVDFAFNEGFFGLNQKDQDHRRLRGQLSAARESSRLVFLGDATYGPESGSVLTWAPRYGTVHPTDPPDGISGATGPVPLAAAFDAPDDPRVFRSALPDGRHRGGANVLFADGHAVTLPATREGTADALLATE